MKRLEIYDPAMCCSTGVCGPSPGEQLTAFAGQLKRFADRAEIHRFNLAQEPAAFAGSAIVKQVLTDEGPDALPVVLVDGKLAMKGVYPSGEQLEQLLGASSSADSCCGDEADESCCASPEQSAGAVEESSCCDSDSCC
jgi:hypothetical protein